MRRSLAAVVVVVAMAASPGVAAADHLACGAILETSTTLDRDLVDCPGDGLVLAASGITLDLNGYTIDGDESTGALGRGAGVRVLPGVDDTRIVGPGVITEFSEGVILDSNSGTDIVGLTLDRNTRGIAFANASNALVQGNTVRDSFLDGIRVNGSGTTGNTIKANRLQGNVFGLTVSDGAASNLIENNTITGSAWGVALFSAANDNVVQRNQTLFNTVGISVGRDLTGNELIGNTANNNTGDGISVQSPGTFLARNVANGNGGAGITGTYVDGGRNVTRSNGAR